MPANQQPKPIKVRIIKKPGEKKSVGGSVVALNGKKWVKRPSEEQVRETEQQKKKLIIGVSVTLIMLVIFITWLAFLGNNLSHVKATNDTFWHKIAGYVKVGFSGFKNEFSNLNTSVNNANGGAGTELENAVFPNVK
jgi:hypothetical protein